MNANTQVGEPEGGSPAKQRMTIILRPEGLQMLCDISGITTDKQLAARIGINQSNLSRVRSTQAHPGVPFIAGALHTFGGSRAFDTLFEIILDPKGSAA